MSPRVNQLRFHIRLARKGPDRHYMFKKWWPLWDSNMGTTEQGLRLTIMDAMSQLVAKGGN